jgi:menaquinone-dependent protoporphyrinogen oxidase
MKILIIYGTSEGQTRKIARFMEDVLQESGHQVAISNANDEPPVPEDFEAVIVGSSVHYGKYQSSVRDYVLRHADTLNQKRSAFFSVSLAMASKIDEEHKEAEEIAKEFLANTGWNPDEVMQVAGALRFTKYDYFKRLIMRMIAKKEGESVDVSQDYEYTDWNAVEKSVLEFVEN